MVDTDLNTCARCGMDKAEWSEEAGHQTLATFGAEHHGPVGDHAGGAQP